MKIFQVMAGAQYGGAEAFFVRLVVALANAGISQKVAIRRHTARAEKLRAGGIEPVQLRFGGTFDIATWWSIRREIKRYQPDIVLSWMNRATAACPRGKFVHVGRLGGYYNLNYYRHCDHLIANTLDIADYVVKNGWPQDRVHYLPNFVDATPAAPEPRRKHYTPDTSPLIFALGRMHDNKAFDVLLDALAHLPDAYLWLAGEGERRKSLEEKAQVLGIKPRVRFLGWTDDPAPFYEAADIFVCPSRHEPLGNVVIEAWAHSIPVVATDSLGPGTLIENDHTGVLVPVDDSMSLTRALRRLVQDHELRKRLAQNGRAEYETKFTEAIAVAAYRKFFDEITA
jgi:glycosyltransferase involved in cell wall biosynthesis